MLRQPHRIQAKEARGLPGTASRTLAPHFLFSQELPALGRASQGLALQELVVQGLALQEMATQDLA